MSPLQVALAWQQAANQQDIEQLMALSDPDIEIIGPRGSAFGHDILRQWLARAGLTLSTRRMFARENTVVIAQHGIWRSSETGNLPSEAEVASCFVCTEGRVTKLSRHDHLTEALQTAGLTENDEVLSTPEL